MKDKEVIIPVFAYLIHHEKYTIMGTVLLIWSKDINGVVENYAQKLLPQEKSDNLLSEKIVAQISDFIIQGKDYSIYSVSIVFDTATEFSDVASKSWYTRYVQWLIKTASLMVPVLQPFRRINLSAINTVNMIYSVFNMSLYGGITLVNDIETLPDIWRHHYLQLAFIQHTIIL